MKFKAHITGLIVSIICTLQMGAAAEIIEQCQTPPQTLKFITEIQAYTNTIRDYLAANGCSERPEATLFGLNPSFDLGEVGSNIGGRGAAFLEQNLSEAFGVTELLFMVQSPNQSAQHFQDVETVSGQLEILRDLTTQVLQSCAANLRVKYDEQGGVELLQENVRNHYLVYRMIYFWLMKANETVIPDIALGDLDGLLQKGSSKTYITEIIQRYRHTQHPTNGFFVPEYQSNAHTQCQARDYGFNKINESVDRLDATLKDLGQNAVDIGNDVYSSVKDGVEGVVNTAGAALGKAMEAYKNSEDKNQLVKLGRSLLVGANEIGKPLEQLMGKAFSLRLNGRAVTPKSIGQIAQQAITADAESGRLTQPSIGGFLNKQREEQVKYDTNYKEAQELFIGENLNREAKFRSTQLFVTKWEAINQMMEAISKETQATKELFTTVCQKHLYRNNDDCGEDKK